MVRRGLPRHARRRRRAARCRRARSPTATACELRTALRELVADGTVTKITRHRPARTSCCTASRDGRTDLVEDRLRAARRQARRRRQRAAPPVDRLPGPADVRAGAGRGRAGAARPRHRAGEGARRLRQRRRADPAQHDRLPERLRPPVQQRDRHRRADQEGLRPLRRRLGGRRPPGPAHPHRRAARPDRRHAGAGVRPVRRPRADKGATFGDWSDGVGAETIATWLPEPVVRGAGAARPAAEPAPTSAS